MIFTNNGHNVGSHNYKLGSHVVFREKNHIHLKDQVFAKKFKIPRNIGDDYLIYENETTKGKFKGYKLPMNVDKL